MSDEAEVGLGDEGAQSKDANFLDSTSYREYPWACYTTAVY